jgi:hypothetical protein
MQRGIHVRKIMLFAVAALVLIGIGAWIGVRTFALTGALADSTDKPPMTMTGGQGPAYFAE